MLTLSSAFPTTSVLPNVCKWDVMTLEKKKYIQRHETNRGKNLFVIPAVILDLQRERLIVSVFLFIFLAAGFRLNPLNLPSPPWSQNKSALVQFYRKRKYWSHILLQQRINDMESLHCLAKQNHLQELWWWLLRPLSEASVLV